MAHSLFNKHIISIPELTRNELELIVDTAARLKAEPNPELLKNKVVASCFFEPSTRTRLSFETAVQRLGGTVIGFDNGGNTSLAKKGETLADSVQVISSYVDAFVMRHPQEGAARLASEFSNGVPVVNGGDGANQHPTQTMLDLYSIYKTQGTLENLNIFMVGDLKYGRTVHSLLMAMSHFNPTFHFIAPKELEIPLAYKIFMDKNNIKYQEHTEFDDIINDADILYMTRVQRERFADPLEYEKVKNVYILKNDMLENTKDNLRILHPLPRVNEIAVDVDSNPKAYYFEQALNGVYARQAIIAKALDL